jgi:hypothetical protein
MSKSEIQGWGRLKVRIVKIKMSQSDSQEWEKINSKTSKIAFARVTVYARPNDFTGLTVNLPHS